MQIPQGVEVKGRNNHTHTHTHTHTFLLNHCKSLIVCYVHLSPPFLLLSNRRIPLCTYTHTHSHTHTPSHTHTHTLSHTHTHTLTHTHTHPHTHTCCHAVCKLMVQRIIKLPDRISGAKRAKKGKYDSRFFYINTDTDPLVDAAAAPEASRISSSSSSFLSPPQKSFSTALISKKL